MKRSLILSNLRIELRRKETGYSTEKNTIRWVTTFLDQMSIVHSSQIRTWQKDLFLSQLKNREDLSYEVHLQAKSSLLFLFERVLKHYPGFTGESGDNEPQSFRITG